MNVNNKSFADQLEVAPSPNDLGDLEYSYQFGWFHYHPPTIQFLNNTKWLIFFISIYIIISGMQTTGLTGVIITSIETRYELRSTETGILSSSYEITAGLCGLLISYYAGQRHKGRIIATGSIIAGLGAILFASPHFFSGKYNPISQEANNLCQANATLSTSILAACTLNSATSLRVYYYIFIIAQVVIGMGNNLMWNVGMAYIAENVDPTSSSVYIGIMVTLSAVGPAIGFLIGGLFLSMWVDWPDSSNGIVPTDPRWVGVWWLGFIICGAGMITIAIPLYAYPPYLPGYAKFKARRLASAKGKAKVDNEYGDSFKNFPVATKEILLNFPCLFSILAATCEAITTTGFAVFLPKFIQSQFGMTSSAASLIAGAIIVPGAGGGMIIGGLVMKHYKLNGVTGAKLNVIFSVLATASVSAFLIGCANQPFATTGLPQGAVSGFLKKQMMQEQSSFASCNAPCNCNNELDPLCGANGVTYYSPCYAGCMNANRSILYEDQIFSNCRCVGNTNITTSTFTSNVLPVGKRGLCQHDCNNLIPFLVILFFLMIFTFFKTVPTQQVLLRCVPESQRSFALGVQWLFLRLAGNVPGPIVLGSIIDRSCILWSVKCQQRSNCWLYDNDGMSQLILILGFAFKSCSAVFCFLAWFFYKSDIKEDELPKPLETTV